MPGERNVTDRILDVLRPYASNWSGSLRRGDLVIPQREVTRVAQEIVEVMREALEHRSDVTEHQLFEFLREISRLRSLQDQAAALRRRFLISERKPPASS